MNKAITIMLIMVGVLLILLFQSFHLEGGNVILFLISVFVMGFMAGGFSNLDNITRLNQEVGFYERLSARRQSKAQELGRKLIKQSLEKDELRLDAVRNFDKIFQELKRLKSEKG